MDHADPFVFRAFRVVARTAVLVHAEGGLHDAEDLRRAGGGADAGGGVEAIETDAVRGESVDVRRFDQLFTVTAEPAGDVFEVDPEDVVLGGSGGGDAGGDSGGGDSGGGSDGGDAGLTADCDLSSATGCGRPLP